MRAPSARVTVLTVAVLAVAGCVGASLARPEPPTTPTGSVQPVIRASAVCARPATHGSTTSSLGLVVAPGPDASGHAVLSDLRTGGTTLLSLDEAGSSAALKVPASDKTAPAVLRAEGTLAPLTSAGLVTQVTSGRSRGLSAVACAAPSSESWFVGGGARVGRLTTVWLSNPDSTQAVVDLEVYGPDGPVVGHGSTGIVVPPHRQTGIRLDVVVPGTSRAALHVVARAGRVAAAVQDIGTRGLIPKGADYVPPAAAPAMQVVVPGILGGGAGTRLLQVAAPGDADAIVNVKVVAADGTFTPENANLLEVAAGSVAQLDLGAAFTGTGPVSVVLDSDVPVIAGVRMVFPGDAGSAETLYAAGTAPLAGSASFAPLVVGAQDPPRVALAAAESDASAVLTIFNPGTDPVTRTVEVPAGTTVTSSLVEALNGAAVVISPVVGSGPLEASLLMSRTDSDGVLRTAVPFVAGPSTVVVPAVLPDPATGVPGH